MGVSYEIPVFLFPFNRTTHGCCFRRLRLAPGQYCLEGIPKIVGLDGIRIFIMIINPTMIPQ